jgi:hypothetical protein
MIIKLLSSDNQYQELQWKKGLYLDLYCTTEVSLTTNDCWWWLNSLGSDISQIIMFQCSNWCCWIQVNFQERVCLFTIPSQIPRVCPSLVPNDYLCESLIGTDCPIIPLMPFHEKRPRAAHRTNPFYVARSSAFIFLHYHSDPIQFKSILEKVQTLLSKTLEIKEPGNSELSEEQCPDGVNLLAQWLTLVLGPPEIMLKVSLWDQTSSKLLWQIQ